MRKELFRSKVVVTLFSLTQLLAYNSFAEDFGRPGSPGRSGRDGQDGRDGQNTVIVADGSTLVLHLNGANGDDGESGEGGTAATSCINRYDTLAYQYGASGGSGGNGGRGGRAGNGGDLTIRTDNLQNLAKIVAFLAPGRAGRGGQPGLGAAGCDCFFSNSNCHNGGNGLAGSVGEPGRQGSYGTVRVIPQSDSIDQPVNRYASAFIPEFFEKPVVLTSHIWNRKNGALALFAPGSQVDDSYLEYGGIFTGTKSFVWAVPRPISDFSEVRASAELNGSSILFDIQSQYGQSSGKVWYKSKDFTESDGSVVSRFSSMLFEDEVADLELRSDPTANVRMVEIVNSKAVSDDPNLETVISIKVQKRNYFFFWGTLFEGEVPSDLIIRDARSFSIFLARLPGIKSKDLRAARKIYVTVTVERKMGKFSLIREFQAYI